MKLSIIVPVYNMAGEGKLKYCLDSLIHQELTDYEIVAVDDASTDASYEILKEYEAAYPDKVRTLRLQVNHRQGGAKNLGMKEAKGEWIGFVDSDDWVAPDMYRRLLQKAEETGSDAAGCQYGITHTQSMDNSAETLKPIQVHKPEQEGILDEEKKKLWILNPGSMVIKIYKKEVIDRYALRFPEGIFYEDNCAAVLWMLRFQKFSLIDEPLYYYYQHQSSTVHTIGEARCRDRMEAGRLLYQGAKEQGFLKAYPLEIEARFLQLYYVNTLFSYMQGVRIPRLRFLKELRTGVQRYCPCFTENPYYPRICDKEQRRLIGYHMKNVFFFVLYYKALYLYRRLRYGKR